MNNKDMGVNIVFAIIYLLIISAMILILINAYKLKGDYNYGEGLKQQCSPLFLEKERGEHQVYMGYIEDGYDKFKKIYLTLLSTSVMVIISAYVLANIFSIYYIIKNKKFADIQFIPFFGLVGRLFTNKIVIIPEVIIIVILLGLLVYWYVGHHGSEKNMKAIHLTSMLNFLKKTPTKISEMDKLKILGGLNLFIHFTFILIILGSAIYNPIINNGVPMMSNEIMFNIIVIYITIAIVMPLITNTIIHFQDKVSHDYHEYKNNLNEEIINIFNSGDKQAVSRIVNELEKNITNDEMDTRLGKDGIGAPPNLFAERKYKEEGDLYKYLMHIINNYDIQNIKIPQELKTILNTVYLGGENSLELKKKLVTIYYRHKEGSLITQEDLKENGNDVDLLPYLTARVRLLMVSNNTGDDAERDKYLNILNTYVVSNTIFKKGNPLPANIIKIMSEHRQNTDMKNTIDKYFYTINTVFTVFLIIFSYFVYHYMIYPNNLDKKLQVVSLVAGILLTILGIAGWLLKEFWL